MDKKALWNNALILSVCFHLLAVPCLGIILNGYLLSPSPFEKHIELELIRTVSAKALDNEPPGQKNEISRPREPEPKQEPERKSPVSNRNFEPIAKDDQAVIDRTVQKVIENPGEKSNKPNSNNIANNSGQIEISGSGQNDNPSSANGNGKQAGGYIRPQLLNKTEPVYPEKARAASREGTVSVSLEVLSNGQVGSVTVKESSGHTDLDDAAVKAVKKWRFVPAKDSLSGQPITCSVNFPVVFQLK